MLSDLERECEAGRGDAGEGGFKVREHWDDVVEHLRGLLVVWSQAIEGGHRSQGAENESLSFSFACVVYVKEMRFVSLMVLQLPRPGQSGCPDFCLGHRSAFNLVLSVAFVSRAVFV